MTDNAPRFMVDSNAGKLAKWLRMMGYDTVFFREGGDREMLERARAEDRIVLTRDTHILQRRVVAGGEVKALLLRDDDPERQLKQVVKTFGLEYFHRPFSLCVECNQPLLPAAPEEVRESVPPYVFRKHQKFFRCPVCRRIYWEGSHKGAVEARLKKLMEEENQ